MYRDKIALKKKLIEIKENDYKPTEDINYLGLTEYLLNNIGDTDPELRDDLIYRVFAHWIIRGVYSADEKKEILYKVLNEEYLFYKIGEIGTDSVFRRTFSVLLPPLLVGTHVEDSYLSAEDIQLVKDKLIEYNKKEKDLRGFVANKGWAHSVAHTSDGFDELAKCNTMNKFDLMDILDAIHYKMFTNEYLYYNGEDERMAVAIISILKRKLISGGELKKWIDRFIDINNTGDYSVDHIVVSNAKNLLRSLYFRLKQEEGLDDYFDKVKITLENNKLQ
ncbi:DUF2785 domain-containing protein [Sporosalibacterium faouarense]|uniref:DUF2785 domain-containing protein n=1 Tax=Sporosalibacterium faouarense TaxID=516123 RepID=UPI00192C2413|nr:DUF2785 domain-containing protein [Sporosalibacterium faouarense]